MNEIVCQFSNREGQVELRLVLGRRFLQALFDRRGPAR